MQTNKINLAYLVAIISGDGTVTKYYIRISDRYRKNIQYLKLLFKNLGIKTYLKKETDKKFILKINSKKFIDYLKRITV